MHSFGYVLSVFHRGAVGVVYGHDPCKHRRAFCIGHPFSLLESICLSVEELQDMRGRDMQLTVLSLGLIPASLPGRCLGQGARVEQHTQ